MKIVPRLMILSILLMIITISCGDQPTVYQYPPSDGRVIGTVHGIVQDRNTNARLVNVDIYYIFDGSRGMTNTDSMGYFSISGLFSGEYELTFKSTSDYAVTKASINVPNLDEVGANLPSDEDYPYSIVQDIKMQKKNAGITGTVYARKSPQELLVASGVKVIADFGYFGIAPAIYETYTDNNGVFTFDNNLPSTSYAQVYSLPFTLDGVDYSVAAPSGVVYLTPEVIVSVENVIAQLSTIEPVLLISPFGLDDFPVSSNVKLVFSKAMNTSTFEIELRRDYSSGTELFFESTWSNSNTTLSLNPYVILRENTNYYINMSGVSEDNATFNTNGYFYTEGSESIKLIRTNLEIIDGQYTEEFPVTGNIEMEFNVAVDTSISSISLMNNYNGIYEEYNLTLSTDNKVITINPIDSLANNTTYRLQSDVYSLSGDYAYISIYFGTAGE